MAHHFDTVDLSPGNPPTSNALALEERSGCLPCCAPRRTQVYKQFMPRARTAFRDHPDDLASLRHRYVTFVDDVQKKQVRAQRYARWARYTSYAIATLLFITTLFDGTFAMFEDSDEVMNLAEKLLTAAFIIVMFGQNKLQLMEKADLYSIADDMLHSMGTYVTQGAGMYRSFDTPHDSLPVFWSQFEALSQAIGRESRDIKKGHGKVQGMHLRLRDAVANSVPEYAPHVHQAFAALPTDAAPAQVDANPANFMPMFPGNAPSALSQFMGVGKEADQPSKVHVTRPASPLPDSKPTTSPVVVQVDAAANDANAHRVERTA